MTLVEIVAELEEIDRELHAMRDDAPPGLVERLTATRRQARTLVVTASVIIERAQVVFGELDARERSLAEIERRSASMVESMRTSAIGRS